MVKMGFRGEKKRILTPITYSPIRRLLPRRGGSVVTENQKKPPPSPLSEGECGDGKGEEKLEN